MLTAVWEPLSSRQLCYYIKHIPHCQHFFWYFFIIFSTFSTLPRVPRLSRCLFRFGILYIGFLFSLSSFFYIWYGWDYLLFSFYFFCFFCFLSFSLLSGFRLSDGHNIPLNICVSKISHAERRISHLHSWYFTATHSVAVARPCLWILISVRRVDSQIELILQQATALRKASICV